MSTFVDKAINPKTRQTQEAWFIDDFYGQRQYAVAFRRDGEVTVWFPIIYVTLSFALLSVVIFWQISSYSGKNKVTILPHSVINVLAATASLQFIALTLGWSVKKHK